MKKRDESPYKPENVSLFETLYGKSLLSLGGIDAIENMFSGIALQGLTALDVGFGLGGVAYYLAKTYGMKVSGVELYPWMVDYANQHAPMGWISSLSLSATNPQALCRLWQIRLMLCTAKGF